MALSFLKPGFQGPNHFSPGSTFERFHDPLTSSHLDQTGSTCTLEVTQKTTALVRGDQHFSYLTLALVFTSASLTLWVLGMTVYTVTKSKSTPYHSPNIISLPSGEILNMANDTIVI